MPFYCSTNTSMQVRKLMVCYNHKYAKTTEKNGRRMTDMSMRIESIQYYDFTHRVGRCEILRNFASHEMVYFGKALSTPKVQVSAEPNEFKLSVDETNSVRECVIAELPKLEEISKLLAENSPQYISICYFDGVVKFYKYNASLCKAFDLAWKLRPKEPQKRTLNEKQIQPKANKVLQTPTKDTPKTTTGVIVQNKKRTMRLFDNREKKSYSDACHFFYDSTVYLKVNYLDNFGDIKEEDYRADIVGIVTAYLDTKPKEKYMIFSWSRDIFMDVSICQPQPIKERYLPKCKERYNHYSKYIKIRMGNTINNTNVKSLAAEVCRYHGVELTDERINSVATDINTFITLVDATFETFRITKG